MKQKHIISALVENHAGVLARVASLISGRGFNIDSLAVGETQDPEVSRMTIVTVGDDRVLDQIIKQLSKLIDVISVEDIKGEDIIDRELMLCKIEATAATRNEVVQIANTFRAKIVDVNPESLTVEVTGNESKVDAILELLIPFGVKEVVRTGLVAMSRRSALVAPVKPVLKMKTVQLSKTDKTAKKKKSGKTREMSKDGY